MGGHYMPPPDGVILIPPPVRITLDVLPFFSAIHQLIAIFRLRANRSQIADLEKVH